MSEYPRAVTDEKGRSFLLEQPPLGEGGQGIVFRTTTNPNIAVKLLLRGHRVRAETDLLTRLTAGSGRALLADEEAARALEKKLIALSTLPLPQDLDIAAPFAMLRSHVGYTMHLLTGMVPIRTMLPIASADLAQRYLDSGGLRRRLQLLARLAALLGRLHSIPLVYGDISPNNVFISEDRDALEVWLIDADNLAFSTHDAPSIFTPGFGAPEIVSGKRSATTLSDAYSFAQLAFWVLAAQHPFLGARVEEGPGWDASTTADPEERAFAGELPWILDEEDPSNASEHGIHPRELVVSPRLRALFQRAFGPGRRDALARPSMLAWTEAFDRAADHTVCCGSCGSTFYIARACPWCEEESAPRFLEMTISRFDPETDDPGEITPLRIGRAVFDATGSVLIPRRHVRAGALNGRDEPSLELEFLRAGVRARALEDGRYFVALAGGDRLEPLDRDRTLPDPLPGREWHIHTGPLDTPHRVLSFRHVRATGGGE